VPDAIWRKAGFGAGEQIQFKVSARSITIVPRTPASDDYPRETAMRMARRTPKKRGIRQRDIPNSAPGAERLRVVLDTNLYIAALEFPSERNAALWEAALLRRFRIIVSPAIVSEMAGVLRLRFGWGWQG
jgi:hypothetical protein